MLMNVDCYSTSYGKLLNISKAQSELKKFIITSPNKNLNYEYRCNPTSRLVVISGSTLEEKELTIFNFPLMFKDIKDENVIAVDVRKYVKPTNDYPLNLSEIVKDKAGFNFLINTALIMSDFNNQDFGEYRKLYESITASYALFVSYVVNFLIPLNPLEKLYVETAVCYYANVLLTPCNIQELSEYNGSIIARISHTKLSLPLNKKTIDEITPKLPITDASITTLINVIKSVLPEEKAELIEEAPFINHMSNMWYGPGGNEALIIGLDNIAVWISLVNSCLSDTTYKKSRFSNILEKHSRNIDAKNFIKNIELIIKSKTME